MVLQVFSGLLDEARMLLLLGLKPGDNQATRAIGYRQAMEWLVVRSRLSLSWPITCTCDMPLVYGLQMCLVTWTRFVCFYIVLC